MVRMDAEPPLDIASTVTLPAIGEVLEGVEDALFLAEYLGVRAQRHFIDVVVARQRMARILDISRLCQHLTHELAEKSATLYSPDHTILDVADNVREVAGVVCRARNDPIRLGENELFLVVRYQPHLDNVAGGAQGIGEEHAR